MNKTLLILSIELSILNRDHPQNVNLRKKIELKMIDKITLINEKNKLRQ